MSPTLVRKLVQILFGSRKAALMSSLFGIAILGLLYVAWQQAKGEVHIEMPTGLATGTKTKTVTRSSKPSPEILVLNSYHVGHVWSDNELAGIVGSLKESSPGISCMVEYLDCKRHPKYEHFEQVKELFKVKYGGRDIPVVIVTDNPALEFAVRYRAELFSRSSIVFCGVNNFKTKMLAGQKDITGLAELLDAGGTIQAALKLQPGTREVFVIHDHTSTGLATRREAEEQLKELAGRVTVRFPEDMTQQDMTQFLKNLPTDSLVLALAYNVFRDGKVIAHEDVARLLSESAPVPVYGVHLERLGYGIVGGSLLSGRLHGAQAAGIALRILTGTPASAIPVVMKPPTRLMFDHDQLVRFSIPVKTLPERSVVVNRPVSFVASHRYLVVSVLLVFFLLAAGIVSLGVNVYRRTLAEEALQKSKEELEQRVLERSTELRTANEQLQRELTERRQAEDALSCLNEELEQRVMKRTEELEETVTKLERANRLFVGRELRMVELKERIKELERDTGATK